MPSKVLSHLSRQPFKYPHLPHSFDAQLTGILVFFETFGVDALFSRARFVKRAEDLTFSNAPLLLIFSIRALSTCCKLYFAFCSAVTTSLIRTYPMNGFRRRARVSKTRRVIELLSILSPFTCYNVAKDSNGGPVKHALVFLFYYPVVIVVFVLVGIFYLVYAVCGAVVFLCLVYTDGPRFALYKCTTSRFPLPDSHRPRPRINYRKKYAVRKQPFKVRERRLSLIPGTNLIGVDDVGNETQDNTGTSDVDLEKGTSQAAQKRIRRQKNVAQKTIDQQGICRLWKLPPEIRALIWMHAIGGGHVHIVKRKLRLGNLYCPASDPTDPVHRDLCSAKKDPNGFHTLTAWPLDRRPLSLLVTCRQM